MRYGARGPNSCVVTACTTGTHAIGDAFRIIQRGDADVMIAGGVEAPVNRLGLAGFASMRALSTRNDDPQRASRPFDRGRDGFVIAEAAGVVVLESLEHALARGARIRAEVVGYGMSGDANHMTAPPEDGIGAQLSMRAALRDAGLRPEDVDYVNAHGTSTELNDKIESFAIKQVFGAHAREARGVVDQVDDRPRARRRRRHRGDLLRARPSRRARFRRRSTTPTRTRTAISTTCRTSCARPRCAWRSRTRSASAERTARSRSRATNRKRRGEREARAVGSGDRRDDRARGRAPADRSSS